MQKYLNYATDQAGNIITGVSVSVYLSGTTTLASIFSDNGVTPQANPFTNNNADASLTFYAANGVYDIVMTKTGLTFSATETAGVRLFDPQNFLISVKDSPFYAKGDGVTNDTAAFTSAGNGSGNIEVHVPAGTYLLNSSPTPSGNVTWVLHAGATLTGVGVLPGKIIQLGSTSGIDFLRSNLTNTSAGGALGLKISISPTGSPLNPQSGDNVALYHHISSDNGRTRIWAGNPIVDVTVGNDATAWSLEVDMNNGVANAPDPGNTFHKLGVDVVSGGGYAPSVPYRVSSTTLANRWKHGIWFDRVGGQTSSTLIKTGVDVSVDYGLDLANATINYMGVRVGQPTPGQVAPIGVRQFVNGQVGIFLQRFTDTAPTGNIFQVTNAANTIVLAAIDAGGNIVTLGNITSGNITSGNITAPLLTNGSSPLAIGDAVGDVQWKKALVSLGGGATPTLGTIGGLGPTTPTQNAWARFLDSTGAVFWIPAWK